MPADNMPAAEVDVDEVLVRGLLEAQHPDLAERPLVAAAHGWDNVLYRLGDDLLVRLPRRQAAADLVVHEQRWLPELAPRLPLPIPAPVRTGSPTDAYPWSWTVCPWFPGGPAATATLADPAREARRMGAFLSALHQPAPADAPANPYRGIPLAERQDRFDADLARVDTGADVDHDRARELWDEAAARPQWAGPPVWIHGDLHPANVVAEAGAITAVVDFGDITSGDPATDLIVAWMLFDPDEREELRAAAPHVDDDTWARGRGWALAHGLACVANGADNPLISAMGRRGLHAVLATAR